MSHQSGIKPTANLLSIFESSRESARAIKVIIESEQLESVATLDVSVSWEQGFSEIQSWLEDKTPCFILYRLDAKTALGASEWIVLSYVPDHAAVRQKMLYASSRATLTKELGDSTFTDSIYATHKNELTLEGYRKHIQHKHASAPLTEREQEMQHIKIAEVSVDIGTETRKTLVKGLALPVADSALEALRDLKDGRVNYVQLAIDTAAEAIGLHQSGLIPISELSSHIPKDRPLYTIISIQVPDKGVAIAFVYSCPQKSKVKDRMFYSSTLQATHEMIERDYELKIAKRIETDDGDELSGEYILGELAPTPKSESQPGTPRSFSKPAKPGRGPARIIRPN
ncbi:twinfilin-1 [Polychytrium aggregatum]|uniref:twinfilin-1 n=1 Tax=Polychytrium aggregatum TaxID=110093 RepID=UPI0022FE5741|nr:twinfilin-1 [Polychytrium aggregatum]KAI9206651.1 twinfilin-1 [Polychytrium aggregatum]